MAFAHLHSHSTYSTYDGLGTPEDRARHVAAMGQKALGLSDHGTTSGLVGHYTACKKYGIKPILGCEIYFQWEFTPEPGVKHNHMTILVMDMQGYRNLNQLMTIAAKDFYYRHPLITWELLQQYHEGLIILSGCIAGYVPQAILRGDNEEADRAFKAFHDLLGNRYYAEVMPFESSDNQQHVVNTGVIELAAKYGVEVVLTNDSHYTSVDDRETHRLMFAIKDHVPEADYTNLYLASESELVAGWQTTMEGTPYTDPTKYIATSAKIARRCHVELEFEEAIPRLEWDKPSPQKLAELCKEGLKAKGKYSGPDNAKYRERLQHEFNVIFEKGYTDYFLMCVDIYNFARENGIAHGLGRGSVCGSLLAYAIGLTNVDPLIFGTHFERFLRPNKTTLPDVDMDFESNRRGEIVDYLLRKYEGKAAAISTFGYYKVKNLANDLGKAMGVSAEDLAVLKEQLAELLEDNDATELTDKEDLYKYLISNDATRELDAKYGGILKHFSRLFGQVRYVGRHAAGIAITDTAIEDYTALVHTKDGLQTAYDLNDLGKLNVVKMDILGLITVDVIKRTEELIGKSYDLYDILEDEDSYKAFGEGLTGGVFQFESPLARKICEKVKPENMLELVACNSLCRPGPIKMGLLDMYVAGKNGDADVSGLLYTFMEDSYGTLIYQEQVMSAAIWAGLSWSETDKLIKGISKKTAGKDPVREKFIDGAVAKGMARADATKLYDSVSSYLFNKGHGVGYSLLSFYTMYLKLHHPTEYYLAILTFEQKEGKRVEYELEAVSSGIKILIPHINGKADYSLEYDQEGNPLIRRGLSTIPGVGEKAAQAIEEAGPFTDDMHLMREVPKRIATKTVLAALENAGAFVMDKELENKVSSFYCSTLKKQLYEVRKKEREAMQKKRKRAS